MMLVGLVVAAAAAYEPRAAKTVNFTTYRVTPITYPGLANMDSGDSAGDVMFGMSQLLLPQLCAVDSDFLWCANRAYLSGGSHWMVYSGFVVVTRDAFGEYEACNPCQGHNESREEVQPCPPGVPNGTFVCESYNERSGPPPPPQCDGGYDIWHEDCLNGTIYKTLTGLEPSSAEAACCSACSADNETCAGWNMPDGVNGTTCQLMKEPLIMWNGGQGVSSCKAAEVDHSQYRCWYSNPQYAAFAPYCNKSSCTCDVIEKHIAVGLESNAMCHESMKSLPPPNLGRMPPQPRAARRAVQSTSAGTPNYWHCSSALSEYCFNGYRPAPGCSACALDPSHWPMLEQAGCTKDMVPHICSADFDVCSREVDKVCSTTLGHTSACYSCLDNHSSAFEKANCTALFAEYACSGGHHDNKWTSYIEALACHMHGNWYSTTGTGECKGKELTDDCWWYIDREIRTVNASCVDNAVVASVQAHDPSCWTDCPGDDGKNISSACFLTCLFETLLGNSTKGTEPIPAATLTKTFEDAFVKPVGEGGCEAVHKPHGHPHALGQPQQHTATVPPPRSLDAPGGVPVPAL